MSPLAEFLTQHSHALAARRKEAELCGRVAGNKVSGPKYKPGFAMELEDYTRWWLKRGLYSRAFE